MCLDVSPLWQEASQKDRRIDSSTAINLKVIIDRHVATSSPLRQVVTFPIDNYSDNYSASGVLRAARTSIARNGRHIKGARYFTAKLPTSVSSGTYRWTRKTTGFRIESTETAREVRRRGGVFQTAHLNA